jgi:hypothetical protein
MMHYYPRSKADDDQLINRKGHHRHQIEAYPVTEFDLTKLSKLFGCLEEALKEMIRNKGRLHPDDFSETYLYEMTSRAPFETEDPDLPGPLDPYQEEARP